MAGQDFSRNDDGPASDAGTNTNITRTEAKEVRHRQRLRAPVIYEIIRRGGREELGRPAKSLFFSGAAAGVSLSFSVLAQALLRSHLPDADWRPLIECLGYSVGFLIVVLGRQQLFTENTITAILPLVRARTRERFLGVGRLWSIVLLANLVGTFAAALFNSVPHVLDEATFGHMMDISRHAMDKGWMEMLLKGVTAGFLVAAMVWLLAAVGSSEFLVIVTITYIIALGEFTHVIAGSFEAFLLVVQGEMGVFAMVFGFLIPALIGNIIGGTALFTVISYGQVAEEI
ncbi:formate/nitrite transporter family protein [Lutibaculum baratangense]|uniref:Transport n=1 Tax=Lutibaculum baratangense AMV1 TaxID=631454 RepID=V4TEF1_9HYPH|nr:formate/nitrite transporter family protein [Lutibaculum baratangense]ESR24583.1 hypothetical protein N177_2417 [Lutibaculum baratangense AMV1]